jgi:hypothetical protein
MPSALDALVSTFAHDEADVALLKMKDGHGYLHIGHGQSLSWGAIK